MSWKKWIPRAIFLACLMGIGSAVHFLLPPAPRWELRDSFKILGITSDSKLFWAIRTKLGYDQGNRTTLQLRDFANGELRGEFLKSEPFLRHCEMSPSGRFVIGHDVHINSLHLIDHVEATERIIPLDPVFRQLYEGKHKQRSARAYPYQWYLPEDKYVVFTPSSAPISKSCFIDAVAAKTLKQVDVKGYFHEVSTDGTHAIIWTNRNASNSNEILWDIVNDRDVTKSLGDFNSFLRFVPETRQVLGHKMHDMREAAVVNLDNFDAKLVRGLNYAELSRKGRWLIDTVATSSQEEENGVPIVEESKIIIREVLSGNHCGSLSVRGMPMAFSFADDDSLALVTLSLASGKSECAMLQLPSGAILWTHPLDDALTTGWIRFSSHGSVVLTSGERVEIWDKQTGKTVAAFSPLRSPDNVQWSIHPQTNLDHRVLLAAFRSSTQTDSWKEWLQARIPQLFPQTEAFAIDTRGGQVVLKAPLKSEFPYARLTPDGNGLLISDLDGEHQVHRAYDIPARPRWAWVLGVPGGVGAILLGWRRWRDRKSRKPTTGSSVAAPSESQV